MNNIELNYNTSLDIFEDITEYSKITQLPEVIDNDKLKEHINLRNADFYKLQTLSYDHDYPRRKAFENVLGVMDNPEFNFVYLISGKPQGVDIYLGVVRNYKSKEGRLHASDCGMNILNPALLGNYQGTHTDRLNREEIHKEIIKPLSTAKRASLITGIPSLNQSENELDFQGIDRLINSMYGQYWQLLVVCEPVSTKEAFEVRNNIYSLYNDLYKQSEISLQSSKNHTENRSTSEGKNTGRTKTMGSSKNKGQSSNSSSSDGRNSSGSTQSKSTNQGISTSYSKSNTVTNGISDGKSQSTTINLVNKEIQEILNYIDEELLRRVKLGISKELFKTSIYALAKNKTVHERLQWSIMSIFQGDNSTFSPLKQQEFSEKLNADNRKKLLCNFQTYETPLKVQPLLPTLFSNPLIGKKLGLSTYMTAAEVSLIAGIPIKEVSGLPLNEGVEFGLNIKDDNKKGVYLGNILQRGRTLNNELQISQGALNKHVFIAGVTGAGKTTTCHRLLLESNLPFLVIEPAKTEYRELFKSDRLTDLSIYTLGNDKIAPFRLNPFELLPGESITSHIDMLKACFTAAFPMEAAMPQILEMAIYKTYEDKGWDIDTDENILCEDPWNSYSKYWPTFDNLVEALKEVVTKQGFGKRLESDYIGSLVSRISNLTIGAKGKMLNCRESIDFFKLIKGKVILELDEIKSAEDKSLIMAFILTRLSQILKLQHKRDADFRHLTLVEEAHRLLSRVHPGEGGSRKHAVEMFCDMLSEVRKYGEGLIIVDQIPNKLAPDVIKNTNTKIIHKLFAKDDKEVVGDTMAMNDKQKEFLSRLDIGEAIVFSHNWYKPVHVKVKEVEELSTDSKDLSEDKIYEIGIKQIESEQNVYFPEVEEANIKLDNNQIKVYSNYNSRFLKQIRLFMKNLNSDQYEIKTTFDKELLSFKNNIRLEDNKLTKILVNKVMYNINYNDNHKIRIIMDNLLNYLVKEDQVGFNKYVNENELSIRKLSKEW
ncbi:MAG: ATP-binding protein [bacterium]